jgi:tetratricopeptide (TPR) repeat protein
LERQEMPILKAFIARSFAHDDEQRIRPILDFLDTFQPLGFICDSADAAEVELVSQKVRRMISEMNVFIGFFTRRYPVYELESSLSYGWKAFRGQVQPKMWTAPAWVLQESGYALCAHKDLILLREEGVETFGLQGDLEYVPFNAERPSEVYGKLNEMIHRLIAKAAGTELQVVIAERREDKVALSAPPNPAPPVEDVAKEEEPSFIVQYTKMIAAQEGGDIHAVREVWENGQELINTGKMKIDVVFWDCLYHELRFEMGASGALEDLKRIRDANVDDPRPSAMIAACLVETKEFEQAAPLYLEAATRAKSLDDKGRYLLNAAKAFAGAKEYSKGTVAIENAIPTLSGELLDEAIRVRYKLLQDSGQDYFAFATAEASLHANPLHSLRFQLGLDYRQKDLKALALSHFSFLYERNRKDPHSLHNLALLCADCELPITSVGHYKTAFSLGETLSAANLGFMYLDAGMTAEAKELMVQAMEAKDHDSSVERCLAEIARRKETEQEKENELNEDAVLRRNFLSRMGRALSAAFPSVTGVWSFPFGNMPLAVTAGLVSGTVEISGTVETESQYSTLADMLGTGVLGGLGGRSTRKRKYTLKGELTGSVCTSNLSVEDVGQGGILGGISTTPKSGFIVFHEDAETAEYVELTDSKLGAPVKLTKWSHPA